MRARHDYQKDLVSGITEQEPELDAEKTVFENVMDGVTRSRRSTQAIRRD